MAKARCNVMQLPVKAYIHCRKGSTPCCEIKAAKSLYEIVRSDSRIGYEATNHYFYTVGCLQEKVLNCLHIRASLLAKEEDIPCL